MPAQLVETEKIVIFFNGKMKRYITFWIYLFIFDMCDILLRMYEINLLRDEDTMFFGPEIGIYIYFELTLLMS